MHHAVVVLVAVILCLQLQKSHNYEFCRGKEYLCEKSKHIVCDPSIVAKEGELLGFLPMTTKVRNMIVDLHNSYRDKTACGAVHDKNNGAFPKATRMRLLVWDYELAFVAQAHAGRCSEKPDGCHNTDRFRKSGQNVAAISGTPIQAVMQAVDGWFGQASSVPDGAEMAKELPATDQEAIASFAVMVNDRVSRVGCSMAHCNTTKAPSIYIITCNYDYKSTPKLPVYQSGEMGSRCIDWATRFSPDYQCLCDNSGRIYQPLI